MAELVDMFNWLKDNLPPSMIDAWLPTLIEGATGVTAEKTPAAADINTTITAEGAISARTSAAGAPDATVVALVDQIEAGRVDEAKAGVEVDPDAKLTLAGFTKWMRTTISRLPPPVRDTVLKSALRRADRMLGASAIADTIASAIASAVAFSQPRLPLLLNSPLRSIPLLDPLCSAEQRCANTWSRRLVLSSSFAYSMMTSPVVRAYRLPSATLSAVCYTHQAC